MVPNVSPIMDQHRTFVAWPKDWERQTNIKHDIVFVHGLSRGPVSDWEHGISKNVWPRDFLPWDIPDCRIILYGYPAEQIIDPMCEPPPVQKFSENLCGDLSNLKADGISTVTFVAHGIGGLIVKRALCHSHHRRELYGFLLERLKHVVFLDTPHLGLAEFRTQLDPTNIMVENQWKLWSAGLRVLSQEFDNIAQSIHITSVFSDSRSQNDDASAYQPVGAPLEVCFTADYTTHDTISTFAHRDDHNYERLMKRIKNSLRLLTRDANLVGSVRSWIGPNPDDLDSRKQKRLAGKRFANSFEWFFSEPHFIQWMNGHGPNPLLWITAPSGCGKSVLCSLIPGYLEISQHGSNSACVWLFLAFDEPRTEEQLLRSLAIQILDHVKGVDTDVIQLIKDARSNTAGLQTLIKLLILYTSTTYFLVDGLDDIPKFGSITSHKEAENAERAWCNLVLFLESLAMDEEIKKRTRVRVWCSSQERNSVHQKMGSFTRIQLSQDQDNMRSDVQGFVATFLDPILKKSNQDPEEKFLTRAFMHLGAEANFRWASLMQKSLEDREADDTILQDTMNGLPPTQKDLYQSYLDSMLKMDSKEGSNLSGTILSIVTHAKRPLSLPALQEAISMLRLGCSQAGCEDLIPKHLVRPEKIKYRCAPLVDYICQGEDDSGYLRLSHSSAYEFLETYDPGAVDYNSGRSTCATSVKMSEDTIAIACLKYLMQRRYSKLLHKESADVFLTYERSTPKGKDVREHLFLQYAAKYWYRHCEALQSCETIRRFLQLPQFLTCIQIQSLFVVGHFIQAARNSGAVLKKNLPLCLSREKASKIHSEYNHFILEWGHFLQQGITSHLNGEIDRCFLGALGQKNFLFKQRAAERYRSYRIEPRFEDGGATDTTLGCYHQTINQDGTKLSLWRVVGASPCCSPSTNLKIRREAWYIDADDQPRIYLTETLNVCKVSVNWSSYDPCRTLRFSMIPSARSSYRPNLIESRDNACWMRIGSSEFFRHDDSWQEVSSCDHASPQKPFWEHIIRRRHYVIKSRRNLAYETFESEEEKPEVREKTSDSELSETRTVSDVATSAYSYQEIGSDDSSFVENMDTSSSVDLEKDSDSSMRNDSVSTHKSKSISDSGPSSMDSFLSCKQRTSSQGRTSRRDTRTSRWVRESLQHSQDPSADRSRAQSGSQRSCDRELEHQDSYDITEDSSSSESDNIRTQPGIMPRIVPQNMECDYCHDLISSCFQCLFCNIGNSFDVCQDCHDAGKWCLKPMHQLRKMTYNPRKGRFTGGAFYTMDQSIPGTYIKVHKESRQGRVAIFKYSNTAAQALYDSAPELHPSLPLLVFPVTGDRLLLAAIENNTYLTMDLPRPLRISNLDYTTHIQTRFSDSGEHLYIARLGMSTPESKSTGSMAIFSEVLIYRMRAATALSRRFKYVTGSRIATPWSKKHVSGLPYSLTWTPEFLYISFSGEKLRVLRYCLSSLQDQSFETLQNHIVLPKSARRRTVQFFPGTDSLLNSKIIIGCQQGKSLDPPLIVFFSVGDLGGWTVTDTSHAYSPPVSYDVRKDIKNDWDSDSDCDLILVKPENEKFL